MRFRGKKFVWWGLTSVVLFFGVGLWAFAASAPAVPDDAAATSAAEPEAASFSVIVDVSDRRLYVKKNGNVVESYPVAVGKPGHSTPRGSYSIRRITFNPRWVPPKVKWAEGKKARAPGDPENPMGKAKLFFKEPDYYIHGTPATESLGSAASHGCVRMSNTAVIELAQMVMKNGGEPREAGWFRSIVNRARSTKEVWLSKPVPVTVRT